MLQDVYLMQDPDIVSLLKLYAFSSLKTSISLRCTHQHREQGWIPRSKVIIQDRVGITLQAQTVLHKEKKALFLLRKNSRIAVMIKLQSAYSSHHLPPLRQNLIPLTLFHLLSIRQVQYCFYHMNIFRLKCTSFDCILSSIADVRKLTYSCDQSQFKGTKTEAVTKIIAKMQIK